ncbi:GlxA family transcriptional regulator [Natronospirillum operosum]|uniref:GlxA family transcriptional regulator n=1 Tax=Natronospirillum operosum TaxID=2759953 RepID=A0A4Z0WDD1_9GAMM|nr:GlxA family transcriptional regulator [Natronospirillum operosum]TGG91978.1 GlxA family transcriptional regulator [Natronospirillum operosum]
MTETDRNRPATAPGQESAAGETPRTFSVGFLLINNFTLFALASSIEPLRMANQLSGRELYSWQLLSADGQPVSASDGISIGADASLSEPCTFDLVIVVGGVNITRSFNQKELAWLRAMGRRKVTLGAVCTGSYVLAMAGVLDGYSCSAHWECLAALQEQFPKVNCSSQLYTIDRDRITCTGGGAPLDMMLTVVTRHHGTTLTSGICDMFVYDRVRADTEQQRVPLRRLLTSEQPKLAEITELMENNIEEPIELDELAQFVGISRRKLERLFLKHLGCTPSRYYLKLRLDRARQLLKQTTRSIIEISSMCGFVSPPHFSRCYRKYTGRSPKEERAAVWAMREVQASGEGLDINFLSPSRASKALQAAQAEPSYGAVNFTAMPLSGGRKSSGPSSTQH